ncbi:OMP_b-brl domain-containing protein [Tenacibaculum sp. 190524A02b]|uniref:OMP_b-brl domain-containing protein n=1 Tax=Tenacibaculum vairaonense TaxID=3137860 RepID=A0ABM9PRB5_9FLAO
MSKTNILLIAMALVSLSVSAQFYVSASGGYAIPSAGVRFGTETTANGVENTYGSYGEGIHTQLRAGYFFNKTFGIEGAFGYLHGADQTSILVDVPNQPFVDVKSRGRAYGASLSLVYKFTNNIYGRFGALIKVGGRTEAVGKVNANLPAQLVNPAAPIGATVPLNMEFTRDYNGRLPLGFIGAIGYKYDLSKKIALFAELEYMGISVTRDRSNIGEFTATLAGQNVKRADLLNLVQNTPALLSQFESLLPLIKDETLYVDSLSTEELQNPGNRELSQKVPYSSFGINFGITYTFGK